MLYIYCLIKTEVKYKKNIIFFNGILMILTKLLKHQTNFRSLGITYNTIFTIDY